MVFNLDPSTTDEELMEIFGQYGEIKEIRVTPNTLQALLACLGVSFAGIFLKRPTPIRHDR